MVRRMLFAALTIALFAPGVASATPPERAGIERARAAGIFIDPAVEPLMEQAPIGTCPNDPAASGCPAVKKVVLSEDFWNVPDDQRIDPPVSATGPVAATASRKVKRLRAHAAGFACYIKVTDASPYYAAGYAQMNANNYCVAGVVEVDIYMVLKKLYNGAWVNMIGRWSYPSPPTKYWSGHLTWTCTSRPYRQWQAQAQGFALVNGAWYAGYATRQHALYCG